LEIQIFSLFCQVFYLSDFFDINDFNGLVAQRFVFSKFSQNYFWWKWGISEGYGRKSLEIAGF